MELRRDDSQFPGKGVTLFRRSVLPAAEPWARLGVLHGYGDHSGRFLHFMEWMAERGVACHALDFRGHGMAGGRRGFVWRWEEYLADLDAFLNDEPLRDAPGAPPRFILGHSHGGLVLAAAMERGLEAVRGAILTAPYVRSKVHVPRIKEMMGRAVNPLLPWLQIPAGLKTEWMSDDEGMRQESRRDPLLLRTATPRWYLECARVRREVRSHADAVSQPLLILHGERDPVADPQGARDFYLQARSEDKTFHLYPGLLHEILRERTREEVFNHVLQWVQERADGLQTSSVCSSAASNVSVSSA